MTRWALVAAVFAAPACLASNGCGHKPVRRSASPSPTGGAAHVGAVDVGGAVHVREAFSRGLPSMDGSRLRIIVLEVTYGPGDSSAPHRHPCPVVGYVVRGAVRMRVAGEAEVVYRAGETFYEAPNGGHVVSANASRDEPATFLASFTCDRETPLSVPLADTTSGGHRNDREIGGALK